MPTVRVLSERSFSHEERARNKKKSSGGRAFRGCSSHPTRSASALRATQDMTYSCFFTFLRGNLTVCALAQELLEVGVGDDVPCEVHASLNELQRLFGAHGAVGIAGVGGWC